ncbi:unnamed protein product [Rodentolepis nana]|uniref:Annexin n=1 Tax=Rodentolepis nana TaxID=102285 RepID=A0A0R3TB79_RODNA|nr:unnamed protein product [Rodentolepis nana]
MQPIQYRPASSHRDRTRTSFRRTHPDYSAYLDSQESPPRLRRLGYHSLDEESDLCSTSNSREQFVNVSTLACPTSAGISPPYSLLNGGSDAPSSSTLNKESEEPACTSSMESPTAHASCYFSGHPTVFPAEEFDPSKDAANIYKAIKCSAHSVFSILKEIECDLTRSGYGNFEVMVILSLEYLQDTVAFALNEYIMGLDTDENILIQGLVPYPNSFMQEVAQSYRKQFSADVIIDLFRHKRGDFRTILMALLQGVRKESAALSMEEMCEDADILHKASEIPLSPNAEVFTRILTQRSFGQIKEIAQCYQEKYEISLEQCIKNGKFGGYKSTLIAIVRYATCKDDLLAEWFHKSIQETATNDWALMQLTLGRSEIDLQDIKKAYRRKYGKPLIKAIASATSGDYKRFLTAMVGY